jgi:DNA adenine methylase
MGDPTALGIPHPARGTQHPARGTRHLARSTAPSTGHATPGTTVRPSVRPLLKWAGGKRQLLPALRTFYPETFGRYFEPFVGSGAVFFDLYASGRLRGATATLTDCNADLIGCYQVVRDRMAEVRRALARLARGHERGAAEHFYAVRERFNAARARLAKVDVVEHYTPALAAMLIYLNRTGFNGLFRLNAAGHFNVPVGRYTRPRICDPDHLAEVAAALGAPGVSLSLAPFEAVLDGARAGDLVYFDPPYAPVSDTARFTSYTARPFTLDDHVRLRDCAIALARRGCAVMVSNSSAPAMVALYEADTRAAAAGLHVFRIPARRAINSRATARGPVTEFLLTNLNPSNL